MGRVGRQGWSTFESFNIVFTALCAMFKLDGCKIDEMELLGRRQEILVEIVPGYVQFTRNDRIAIS